MPLMIKMVLYEIQFDTPALGDLNLNIEINENDVAGNKYARVVYVKTVAVIEFKPENW